MEHKPSECLNCHAQIPEKASYCPVCGQKVEPKFLSIRNLISEAFSAVTNVDQGIIPTLLIINRPGKLSKLFFEGKRKKYIRPVRLLLISILVLLTAIGIRWNADIENIDEFTASWKIDFQKMESAQFLQNYRSEASISCNPCADTILMAYLRDQTGTSINISEGQLDSNLIFQLFEDSINLVIFMRPGEGFISQIPMSKLDITRLSPRELTEKYKVDGFAAQLSLKQFGLSKTQDQQLGI